MYGFNSLLRWRLPGSCGFEAIVNEAIYYAANIYVLHHVIMVYTIIKMAVTGANLVLRRNLLLFYENY